MYLILGHAFFNQLLHCWFSIVSGDNIDPVSLCWAKASLAQGNLDLTWK